MAQANAQLAAQVDQQGIEAFSIEHEQSDGESGPGPRIELDLTCGLVDLQDEVAVAAAEHAARQPDCRHNKSFEDSSSDDALSASEGDTMDRVGMSRSNNALQPRLVDILAPVNGAEVKPDETQDQQWGQLSGQRHVAEDHPSPKCKARSQSARPLIQSL